MPTTTVATGTDDKPRWRRVVRRVLVWGTVAVLLAAAGGVVWLLNPVPVEAAALQAVRTDPDLAVEVHADHLVLRPADASPRRGIVFYPGAHISPRSYLPAWAPVVEATGTAVFVPEMPLNIAILDGDAATEVVAHHPEIATWWFGGHSMGGIAAAGYVASRPPAKTRALVLWAAFPPREVSLAARDNLPVLVVAGGADTLVPPTMVRDRLDRLPAGTRLVVIEEMTHSQFGAYVSDPDPAVPDARAAARVAEITTSFIRSVSRRQGVNPSYESPFSTNGLMVRTPVAATSVTFRVTRVRSSVSAVAANRPSTTGNGSGALIRPQVSATAGVTGRMRRL